MARAKGQATITKQNLKLETLRIEYVPVGKIKPNTWNPNRQSDHDFALLIRSMAEDGFTQPIVVQEKPDANGYHEIVDGEHRWTAAMVLRYCQANGLGWENEAMLTDLRQRRLEIMDPAWEIPVVKSPMSPEQMRIATLRHNRARGSEDLDLTAALMRDLRALGALDWAQDSLMLDDAEMQKLLDDIPAPTALAADQYSSAWAPSEGVAPEVSTAPNATQAMTPAAIEVVRAQERQVEAARTEEEKSALRRDLDVFRLSLVFTGEEAVIVKQVLGEQPAVKLLEMCRASATA